MKTHYQVWFDRYFGRWCEDAWVEVSDGEMMILRHYGKPVPTHAKRRERQMRRQVRKIVKGKVFR